MSVEMRLLLLLLARCWTAAQQKSLLCRLAPRITAVAIKSATQKVATGCARAAQGRPRVPNNSLICQFFTHVDCNDSMLLAFDRSKTRGIMGSSRQPWSLFHSSSPSPATTPTFLAEILIAGSISLLTPSTSLPTKLQGKRKLSLLCSNQHHHHHHPIFSIFNIFKVFSAPPPRTMLHHNNHQHLPYYTIASFLGTEMTEFLEIFQRG